MAPLDRCAEHRAQDVVNVVRCPGCVSVADQVSHVRLNLLPRDLRHLLVAESREQMLLENVPMILCVECLYIGNT